MEGKFGSGSYVSMMDQDEPQTSSETGADSPLSGDEPASSTAPPPKKSRRSIKKRVVQVAIEEVEGSRIKVEAYPPSDSWAWRKYGQKPIKGSPYPRGYYRCSSSKGCAARKQVERSKVDPTMLLITYASEHNHPPPTSKHQHHHKTAVTPSTPIVPDEPTDDLIGQPKSPIRVNSFGDPPHLEFVGDKLILCNSGIEYSWISDFTFTTPASKFDDNEVGTFAIREEDESLFGDLDELPECSAVFRRVQENAGICSQVAPLCGST